MSRSVGLAQPTCRPAGHLRRLRPEGGVAFGVPNPRSCWPCGHATRHNVLVHRDDTVSDDEEIRRRADAAATEAGWDLEKYEAHEPQQHDDGSWSVAYLGKNPLPGNFFMVHVDPRGPSRVVPGR